MKNYLLNYTFESCLLVTEPTSQTDGQTNGEYCSAPAQLDLKGNDNEDFGRISFVQTGFGFYPKTDFGLRVQMLSTVWF